jgi:hypothetical protein
MTARLNTNRVLSIRDRISIFPIWGFLKGGSSNVKEEGIFLNIVVASIRETIKVVTTPKTTRKTTVNDAIMLPET